MIFLDQVRCASWCQSDLAHSAAYGAAVAPAPRHLDRVNAYFCSTPCYAPSEWSIGTHTQDERSSAAETRAPREGIRARPSTASRSFANIWSCSATTLQRGSAQGGVAMIRKLLPATWSDIASALTIVGLVIYTSARLVAEGYYAEFRLSPDDVGITYASIIVPAALAAGAVAVISVVAGSLYMIGSATIGPKGVLAVLAGLVGIVLLVLPGPGLLFIILALSLSVSAGLLPQSLMRLVPGLEPAANRAGRAEVTGEMTELAEADSESSAVGLWLAFLVGAVLLACGLYAAAQWGHHIGREARNGEAPNTYPFSLLRVSSLSGEPVQVTLLLANPAEALPGEWLLLGNHDGQLFLYSITDQQLSLIPVGTARVEFVTE